MPVDKELVEKISKLSRLNIDESKINDFVDNQFQSFVKDLQNYFATIKKTFGQFMYMIEQFGRAFTRFNEESIQPFFKSVGKFVSKTSLIFDKSIF